MKSDLLTKRITRTAIIAAIYAATTLAIAPFAYGSIQFRISEILVLLALFDPLYISGLTLGCLIANMLGPNGLLDIIFGTLATFISLIAIYFTGKIIKNYKKGAGDLFLFGGVKPLSPTSINRRKVSTCKKANLRTITLSCNHAFN